MSLQILIIMVTLVPSVWKGDETGLANLGPDTDLTPNVMIIKERQTYVKAETPSFILPLGAHRVSSGSAFRADYSSASNLEWEEKTVKHISLGVYPA